MSSSTQFTFEEYQAVLRNDFTSFIERSFYELNPQATSCAGQYIELLAATLEKCRTGETKRLIINLPPRTLKSHAATVAFSAGCLATNLEPDHLRKLWPGPGRQARARLPHTCRQQNFYRIFAPVQN